MLQYDLFVSVGLSSEFTRTHIPVRKFCFPKKHMRGKAICQHHTLGQRT